MIVEFIDEAKQELIAAAVWYETREPGLGQRFRNEIAYVVERIVEDPLLWRERDGGYRRVNCPVFTYYVAYFIRQEKIIIVAVAHGYRHPDYWKARLTPPLC